MIKEHYKASVSLDNGLDTSSTAGSDSKKSRKTRKKNRWQPYAVPSRRTFSGLGTSGGWQPYTSKEWPNDSSGRLERLADKGMISIAASNSGYSRCVAVESTCLEKFEDTIGIGF